MVSSVDELKNMFPKAGESGSAEGADSEPIDLNLRMVNSAEDHAALSAALEVDKWLPSFKL
jgi:hypothetical protein